MRALSKILALAVLAATLLLPAILAAPEARDLRIGQVTQTNKLNTPNSKRVTNV